MSVAGKRHALAAMTPSNDPSYQEHGLLSVLGTHTKVRVGGLFDAPSADLGAAPTSSIDQSYDQFNVAQLTQETPRISKDLPGAADAPTGDASTVATAANGLPPAPAEANAPANAEEIEVLDEFSITASGQPIGPPSPEAGACSGEGEAPWAAPPVSAAAAAAAKAAVAPVTSAEEATAMSGPSGKAGEGRPSPTRQATHAVLNKISDVVPADSPLPSGPLTQPSPGVPVPTQSSCGEGEEQPVDASEPPADVTQRLHDSPAATQEPEPESNTPSATSEAPAEEGSVERTSTPIPAAASATASSPDADESRDCT